MAQWNREWHSDDDIRIEVCLCLPEYFVDVVLRIGMVFVCVIVCVRDVSKFVWALSAIGIVPVDQMVLSEDVKDTCLL